MSRPAIRRTLWPVAVALALAVAAPSARAAERMIFDIYLLGLKAGELEIASDVGRQRYALAGRLESTGLIAAIRRVRYGAESRGRVTPGGFVPEAYSESTDTGKRRNSARMEYRAGVPQVKTYTPARPPEPEDVDPATQAGTLDPLTGLYHALRDMTRAEACQSAKEIYDGRRATRLRIVPDRDDPLRCRGVYTRVAGYDPEELAEQREFPFEMRLEPAGGDRLRVSEIVMRSLYGRARLVRR